MVVVTFNAERWVDVFLGGSRPDEGVDYLVVDNHSSDKGVALVRGGYPFVKIIESGKNLGFGGGNNLGIRYALTAGYEYVLLLNQDASIERVDIDRLIGFARDREDTGIVSPLHYSETGALDYKFARYIKDAGGEEATSPFTVRFVNAAIWLLPVAALRRVGLFDDDFLHYGEDNDFANRIRYHGLKTYVLPTAKGIHYRKQRGESHDKFKYAELINRRGITILKDINASFPLAYLKYWCYLFVTHRRDRITRGRNFSWTALVRSLFEMHIRLPALIRRRATTKRSGAFLSDQKEEA